MWLLEDNDLTGVHKISFHLVSSEVNSVCCVIIITAALRANVHVGLSETGLICLCGLQLGCCKINLRGQKMIKRIENQAERKDIFLLCKLFVFFVHMSLQSLRFLL